MEVKFISGRKCHYVLSKLCHLTSSANVWTLTETCWETYYTIALSLHSGMNFNLNWPSKTIRLRDMKIETQGNETAVREVD
jgi:hypothetical protein